MLHPKSQIFSPRYPLLYSPVFCWTKSEIPRTSFFTTWLICSENKCADQLSGYRAANLRLVFSDMPKAGFHMMQLIWNQAWEICQLWGLQDLEIDSHVWYNFSWRFWLSNSINIFISSTLLITSITNGTSHSSHFLIIIVAIFVADWDSAVG